MTYRFQGICMVHGVRLRTANKMVNIYFHERSKIIRADIASWSILRRCVYKCIWRFISPGRTVVGDTVRRALYNYYSFQLVSKPHAESESDSVVRAGSSNSVPIELARFWFGVVGTLRNPISLLSAARFDRFFTECAFGGGIIVEEIPSPAGWWRCCWPPRLCCCFA